jgi:F0F1-type ATP synthase membrane subunit b/b'
VNDELEPGVFDIDAADEEVPTRRPRDVDSETLLLRLRELVDTARQMPLSASVMINREEFAEIISDALDGLPDELREARWLLKEREEFLAQARKEADQIVEAAGVRAERMVERTEVVREARRTAEAIVDDAEARARQIRNEAEDYVDQKLAAFEVVLERTMATVRKGRERLQVHTGSPALAEEAEGDAAGTAFFDQDEG